MNDHPTLSDGSTLSRRRMLRVSSAAAASTLLLSDGLAGATGERGSRTRTLPAASLKALPDADETYPFSLPPLPYAHDALDRSIDAQTMEIHHGRHHQGYVNNLNAALEDHPSLQTLTLGELVANWRGLSPQVRTALRNHGGGHLNHALFWPALSPDGGGAPVGTLGQAIKEQWGTMDAFRNAFSGATGSVFGSGWGWLAVNASGTLEVVTTPNQDNPLSMGMMPILGLDVWEHAYYLRYQNRRGDYIQAFWDVVDWEECQRRYARV